MSKAVAILRYRAAACLIRSGDVLLFRRARWSWRRPWRWLLGYLIGVATRSDFTHAGMGQRRPGRLDCIHTIQGRGGERRSLRQLVEQDGETILVRRPRSRRYRGRAAAAYAAGIVGKPYGWWALLVSSVVHLPIIRLCLGPRQNGEETDATPAKRFGGLLPFCSFLVGEAMSADRGGRLDPVAHLKNRRTEPGDLLRSAAMQDVVLIVPQKKEPKPAKKAKE